MSELLVTSLTTVILIGFAFSLPSFAVPYLILRLRDSRNDRADTQLGLKSALYFLFSMGIILFIYGLTALVVDLLLDHRVFNNPPLPIVPQKGLTQMQRIGIALIVAGLVVALLHLALVKLITQDRAVAVRRMFAGWRLIIHSIVVVSAFTVLMIVLLMKDENEGVHRSLVETRKMMFGVLLVWVPSWILHLVLLAYYSRPLYEPSRDFGTWSTRAD
jgi:hypothetical protein